MTVFTNLQQFSTQPFSACTVKQEPHLFLEQYLTSFPLLSSRYRMFTDKPHSPLPFFSKKGNTREYGPSIPKHSFSKWMFWHSLLAPGEILEPRVCTYSSLPSICSEESGTFLSWTIMDTESTPPTHSSSCFQGRSTRQVSMATKTSFPGTPGSVMDKSTHQQ